MSPGPDGAVKTERTAAQTNGEALTLILRFCDIAADAGQIHHRYGNAGFGMAEILRCAKDLKLKARPLTTDWARLARTPLPALAEGRDGRFVVLGRRLDGNGRIQDPGGGRPQPLPG